MVTFEDSRNPTWISNNYYTYFRLRPGTDVHDFEKRFQAHEKPLINAQATQLFGATLEQLAQTGGSYYTLVFARPSE